MQVVKAVPELPGEERQFWPWPRSVLEGDTQNLSILSTRAIQDFPTEDLLLYVMRLAITWASSQQTDPTQWSPQTNAGLPPHVTRLPSFYEAVRAWGGACIGLAIVFERLIAEDKTRFDDVMPSPALLLAHTTAAGVPLGSLLQPDDIVNLYQRATYPSGIRRSNMAVSDLVGGTVAAVTQNRAPAFVNAAGAPVTLLALLDERVKIQWQRVLMHQIQQKTTVIAEPDTESRSIRIMAQRATRLHAVGCTMLHIAAAGVRDLALELGDWIGEPWVITRIQGQQLDELLRQVSITDVVGIEIPGSPFAAVKRPVNAYDSRLIGYPAAGAPMAPATRPTTRLALGNPLLQYVDYDERIPPTQLTRWINAIWDMIEYITQIKSDLNMSKNIPLGSSTAYIPPVGNPRQPAATLRTDVFQPRTTGDPYDLWPDAGALSRVVDNWELTLSTAVRAQLPTSCLPAYYYSEERRSIQQLRTVAPSCVDLAPIQENVPSDAGMTPSVETLSLLWSTSPADLSAFVLRSTAVLETGLAYAIAHSVRFIGVLTREGAPNTQGEEILEPPTREWYHIPSNTNLLAGPAPFLGQPLILAQGTVVPTDGSQSWQQTVRLYPFRWMPQTVDTEALPDQLQQVPDAQAREKFHKPRYLLRAQQAAVQVAITTDAAQAQALKLVHITHWRMPGKELAYILTTRCMTKLDEWTVVSGIKSGERQRPEMSWHPVQVLAVTDDSLPIAGHGAIGMPEPEWWRS